MKTKYVDILIDPYNREFFRNLSAKEIAKYVGCTSSYVYLVLESHDIPFIIQDEWSEEEVNLLISKRKGCTNAELAEIIGSKTKEQIESKIRILELGSFLRDDYTYVTTVLKELGYTDIPNRLNKWIDLGLKVEYKKLGKKNIYKIAKKSDVIQFLKDNQDIWSARKVDEDFLGIEDSWFFEKMKLDKEKIIPKKNSWSREVQYQMYLLRQMGYKNKEIAEVFDAPINSVGNYVYNLEHEYERDFITVDKLRKILNVNSSLLEQYFIDNNVLLNNTISSSKKKYVRVDDFTGGNTDFFGLSKDEVNNKIHKRLVKKK